jgi:hypothetical protein
VVRVADVENRMEGDHAMNRGWQNMRHENKPVSLYKRSEDACCISCGYRNDKECQLRKIKLDVFKLRTHGCRDHVRNETTP